MEVYGKKIILGTNELWKKLVIGTYDFFSIEKNCPWGTDDLFSTEKTVFGVLRTNDFFSIEKN